MLQILLYSILQHENTRTVNSIFNSVTQNTVSQIESLNNNIAEISSLLAVHNTIQETLYEHTHLEIVRNMNNIQKLLSEYRTRNKNIAFLGLIKEHSLFMSDEDIYLYDEVRNIIAELSEPKNSTAIYTPSFIYEDQIYFACITPVFPTNVLNYTPHHTGNFVVCIYEMNSISYAAYDFIDNNQIGLVITDIDNNIMLSANIDEHNTKFMQIEKSKNILYKTLPLKKLPWNVTVFMPSNNVVNLSYLSRIFIAVMILTTFVMLVLMFKLLNDIIIKKIVLLKDKVKKISDSDTSYRITYDYEDELREIVTVINRVLESIHELNEDKLESLSSLYESQLLQKETQIFYLHGQVSPHFLYNSLSHIQGIAFQYNATEIVHITSSLAKVFRYFSNNIYLSTIRQDLDCAIEYFNVINMRRENPINLINTVHESLMSIRCLKMIYQPILENVLKHAFDLDEVGTVTISSIPDDKKAIIEIKDNGRGMSPDVLNELNVHLSESELSQVNTNEHIGILNVNMRLKLYYNKDCGIEIESQKNQGTAIRIIFEKETPPESSQIQIK
ncbi:MAG: histidine kinase [Clostridia bacterium]|nr:histidine kinase [Clostridia bacterium]